MRTSSKTEKSNKGLVKSTNQFPVVGIGASAGGLNAFKQFIKAIPENSGIAYVLVQHLNPKQDSLLPELLQKITTIPVLEIIDDMRVIADHIYIIPSNKMLYANDGILKLMPRPDAGKNKINLPIDFFFTSLAEVHQSHAIGVVLSGTAFDGTKGLQAIKEKGGLTFAQDEDSAAYDGMPNSAVMAGVVDFVLPPEEIVHKICEIKNKDINNGSVENLKDDEEELNKQILLLLKHRKGTDFTFYKQSTIRRRILRRMGLNKDETLANYLKFLKENKGELDILYQDLLIPVTSFFRDPKIFQHLCEIVFPGIIKMKRSYDTIRIWIAGCSTGEEAYSIAICIKEYLSNPEYHNQPNGDFISDLKVQIFATDLSEIAISKARAGIYSKPDISLISPQRIKDFFTKNENKYQVNKDIRDMCVFAVHDFLKDPPFGKIDFLSCRNVLIYMEAYLQKKALTTFHYALNPKGFLLLGRSETIGKVPDHYSALAELKNEKLFVRKDISGKFMRVTTERTEQNFNYPSFNTTKEKVLTDFQKTADDIMLNKYTPAGVVINEDLDIVHFRGGTGMYLEPAPGKASLNLLKMAKDGLAFELRNIVHKAKKEKHTVIKENIPMLFNGTTRSVTVEAVPLPNIIEPHFLILFYNSNVITNDKSSHNSNGISSKIKKDEKDLRIKQLEIELAQVREDMRTITEDQEAANEELQSANEELLSGSEELQSLNEELETSKEEMQSTNEELIVLNHEMIDMNEQVSEARDYAEAIVETIREPLLILNENFIIKTANKAFYSIFKVKEIEVEGRSLYELGNREWDIIELRRLLEKVLPEKCKFNDFEVSQNFSNIGERIMQLNAREIFSKKDENKLILVAIEDITIQKNALAKIKESEHRYHNLIFSSSSLISILRGKDHIITIANDAMLQILGKGKDIIGKPMSTALPEMVEQGFLQKLDDVFNTGIPFYGYEMPGFIFHNGKRENGYFNFTYEAQKNLKGIIEGVSIIASEVTPHAINNEKIAESDTLYKRIIDSLPVAIYTCDNNGYLKLFNKAAVKLWGRSPIIGMEKWCGSHKMITLNEENILLENCSLANALKSKHTVIEEIIIERPDGTRSNVMPNPQPFFNEKGKLIGAVNALIDITEIRKNQKILKENETYFHKIVMQASNGIIILSGEDLMVETANEACLKLTGKVENELLGKPLFKILAETKTLSAALLLNVYQTGIPYSANEIEFEITRFNKKEKAYINIIFQPLRDDTNKVSGVIGIFNEVTDTVLTRKKIEMQAARVNTLLMTAPAFICTLNGPTHIYDLVNPLYQQLIGDRDIKGKPILEALPELKDQEINLILKKVFVTGKPYVGTDIQISLSRNKAAEAELRYFNFNCWPIFDEDKKVHSILVFGYEVTDITVARKKILEDELLRSKALEEKVELRTMELSDANDALQQKNNELVKVNLELESFSYIASHDLQEPLRKIQTFSNRIIEKENDQLSEKGKNYFNRIHAAAKRMQILIDDLLEYSHTGNKDQKREHTNLDKIIEDVINELKETIDEKKAFISYSQLGIVHVNPLRFTQVMINLISNALKFSKKDIAPKIIITTEILKGNKIVTDEKLLPTVNYCHISVADNGIGFDPQYKELIFKVFQRLHGKEEYEGTGIGLAIVKKIIENHNGIITAKSELGKGVTFDIYIPA